MEGNWKRESPETQKTVQSVPVKCIFPQCDVTCPLESMTTHITTCSHAKSDFPFIHVSQGPPQKTIPCEGCGKHVLVQEKVNNQGRKFYVLKTTYLFNKIW